MKSDDLEEKTKKMMKKKKKNAEKSEVKYVVPTKIRVTRHQFVVL